MLVPSFWSILILSVYEEEEWFAGSYGEFNKPSYSEISSYQVEIILPSREIVAATGELVKEEVEEGKKHIYLKADKVRDFALLMSPEYKSITGKARKEEETEKAPGEAAKEQSKETQIEVYYFVCF